MNILQTALNHRLWNARIYVVTGLVNEVGSYLEEGLEEVRGALYVGLRDKSEAAQHPVYRGRDAIPVFRSRGVKFALAGTIVALSLHLRAPACVCRARTPRYYLTTCILPRRNTTYSRYDERVHRTCHGKKKDYVRVWKTRISRRADSREA